MSFEIGWETMNLRATPRVARVEFDAETHWDLVNAVTGTQQDIRHKVERCMNLAKGCPGFFMAVSNMIPPNTPVENALYYNEMVEELGKR